MKSLVASAAASTLVLLASANQQIPQGAVRQDGWGNAIVINLCSENAFYVLDNNPTTATISPSATMSVPLYTKAADGGGGSIKMFTDPKMDLYAKPARACTQFEFTPTNEQVFLDISNVNSNNGEGQNGNGESCDDYPPFMKGGLQLVVPDLEDILCPPGQNPCKTAYSKYNDDFATTATSVFHDIKLLLCPNGGSTGGQIGSGKSDGSGTKAASQSGDDQNDQQKDQSQQSKANDQPKKDQQQSQSQSQSPPPKQEVKVEDKHAQSPSPTEDDDDVVVVSHYVNAPAVTVYSYVYAEGEGNAEEHNKEKRQEHVHQHVHNKIHKRRHGA
ncbi:uncharacterized protein KY384_000256 [Bacidia gigantensis]|uniref:uncharacterized protein n=1 Tax=Bacidia gigantensis TaxID=2732470 RepID=UPI001D03E686|nr:uncharacterized protein KY384_000256 [Bacidia gigantensis]KAG8526263.1 hypothetical protein KY384_000256 [Bacidia gigantensis]